MTHKCSCSERAHFISLLKDEAEWNGNIEKWQNDRIKRVMALCRGTKVVRTQDEFDDLKRTTSGAVQFCGIDHPGFKDGQRAFIGKTKIFIKPDKVE